MMRHAALLPVLLATAALLSGCGGGGREQAGSWNAPGPAVATTPPLPVEEDRTPSAQAQSSPTKNSPPPEDAPPERSVVPHSSAGSEPPLPDDVPSLPRERTLPSPQPAAAAVEDYLYHPGFRNQWGLEAIGAEQAFANLARARGGSVPPGMGVTVGFFDSGILLEHIAFQSRPALTEERLRPGIEDHEGAPASHGSSVASIVGANRPRGPTSCNGCIHGIAWGADLKMFAILNNTDSDHFIEPVTPDQLSVYESEWTADLRWALSHDLDILNASLGISMLTEWITPSQLRGAFSSPIRELAQPEATEKTILVWSAGNMHGKPCRAGTPNCVNASMNASSVAILAGLMAHIEELRGHSIAVVSVNRVGRISSFSNRCGIAAEWCIAAPGEQLRGARADSSQRAWRTASGTSYAAPMVSGSLALMKHFFRGRLNHTELVTRLFATANKSGAYADRRTYGQGMLDLGTAVSPVGEVTVATAGTTDASQGAPLDETRVRLGGAFGDALRSAPAGQEIVAFDRLGAPFWFGLGSLVERSSAPSPQVRFDNFLAARARTAPASWADLALATPRARGGFRLAPLTTTWREQSPDVPFAYLAHATNAAALSWSGADHGLAAMFFATPHGHGFGDDASSPGRTSGAALAWRRPATAGNFFGFGLHAGWLAEEDALLGSSATGAFGQWSTDTMFAGFNADFDMGQGTARHGWRVLASAEVGVSEPTPQGGLVQDLPPLTASAFALRAERAFPDGSRLRFSLAQPLRIESDAGGAALSIPIDRDKESRKVKWRQLNAGLVPSGRQLDTGVRWDRLLTAGTELRLGATWTRHPGHNASAHPEFMLLGGLRHSF